MKNWLKNILRSLKNDYFTEGHWLFMKNMFGTGGHLYFKEKVKAEIYNVILRKGARLQTPMIQIRNQLELKGLWKKDMECLEMFGMFGLWNTIYYIDYVKHIDFFELDGNIMKYAKHNLKGRNVDFFQDDSITYIETTEKNYDMIFSDIPYGLKKYDVSGIPVFTGQALQHLKEKGIFITNMESFAIKNYKMVKNSIEQLSNRRVEDVFFVSASGLIKKDIPTSLLCVVVD